ncbi:hypothetical protein [Luteimonas sp. RC10]|uniref:hypothetical protein n=1 Tax=Luteimonas sp. RC10 TaxID=2587035 RepID=UPI00160E6655|nr:hypothetical protein [Luteimonas sp. RC10]MBB3344172.1 4-hydroxybenzoate polyprenyltransferase [Luteimonas sp. RC10]
MNFWLWLPILLIVPLSFLFRYFLKRSDDSKRRAFSFFALGFFVCVILLVGVPQVIDLVWRR